MDEIEDPRIYDGWWDLYAANNPQDRKRGVGKAQKDANSISLEEWKVFLGLKGENKGVWPRCRFVSIDFEGVPTLPRNFKPKTSPAGKCSEAGITIIDTLDVKHDRGSIPTEEISFAKLFESAARSYHFRIKDWPLRLRNPWLKDHNGHVHNPEAFGRDTRLIYHSELGKRLNELIYGNMPPGEPLPVIGIFHAANNEKAWFHGLEIDWKFHKVLDTQALDHEIRLFRHQKGNLWAMAYMSGVEEDGGWHNAGCDARMTARVAFRQGVLNREQIDAWRDNYTTKHGTFRVDWDPPVVKRNVSTEEPSSQLAAPSESEEDSSKKRSARNNPATEEDVSTEEPSSRLAAPSENEERQQKNNQGEDHIYRIKGTEGTLTPLDDSELIMEDRRDIEAAIEAMTEEQARGNSKQRKLSKKTHSEEECPHMRAKWQIRKHLGRLVRCPRCWNGNAAACKEILYCLECKTYACTRCWYDFNKTDRDRRRYEKRGGKVQPQDDDETVE